MNDIQLSDPSAEHKLRDALVVFGFTSDLACKKIFPTLYAVVKKDSLTVPVIGVASSNWSAGEWRARVRAVVGPVLVEHGAALPYKPGSWGPAEAAALIAIHGGWHSPQHGSALI